MRRERESQLSFSALCENRHSVILLCLLGRRQLHSQSNIIQSSRIKIKVLCLQQSYCKLNNGVFVNKWRRCFQHWMLSVSFWLCSSLIAVSSLDMSTPTIIKCFSLSHKVSHFHAQCWPVPTGSAALSLLTAPRQPHCTKRDNQSKKGKRNIQNKPKFWLLFCSGNHERAL